MTDHLATQLDNAKYIVAVIEDVTVGYVGDVDQIYSRGLYTFSSKDKAEHFTTLCNNTTEGYGDIAYQFERKQS